MKNIFIVFYQAVKRYYMDSFSYQASALAYTSLITLVPLLSVLIFILSIFPIFSEMTDLAKHYAFSTFVPTQGVIIEKYLNNFARHSSKLPVTGLIFSFVTVLMLVTLIKDTINDIWHHPKYKSFLSRVLHWITILILPLLMVIAISGTYYFLSFSWMVKVTHIKVLSAIISYVIPLLINTLCFSALYLTTPNCRVPVSASFVGGLIAAILFDLSKKLFTLYLYLFHNYELIYGTLAVIPVFLLWLYIMWTIVIIGALVTHSWKKLEE